MEKDLILALLLPSSTNAAEPECCRTILARRCVLCSCQCHLCSLFPQMRI